MSGVVVPVSARGVTAGATFAGGVVPEEVSCTGSVVSGVVVPGGAVTTGFTGARDTTVVHTSLFDDFAHRTMSATQSNETS